MASEFGFRPCKIEDLKGQPKVQKVYIKAAQIKNESFPHTIITGQSGCGKAQPVDTIIPTPDGDKRLGDIAVGDYVFDRLGKPTKVLGVFPQGKLDNYKVAATTRGIPRNANSYVARVYDFALVMNDGIINPEIVDEALYVMGINKFGLNQDDMDYMNFLNSNTRAVGVDTICLTLGMDKDTVQTKIEPYLLSRCYIQKQPRGRVITDLGRSMMGECE